MSPAARTIRRRPRRKRDHRPPRRLIVQIAAFRQRRPRRREQPAVERCHAQIAGAAAGVREARDRPQRIPQSRGPLRSLRHVAQHLEAVALAVDGMPQRHERTRFGEQQKQDAIDDGQRLLEGVGQWHERRWGW